MTENPNSWRFDQAGIPFLTVAQLRQVLEDADDDAIVMYATSGGDTPATMAASARYPLRHIAENSWDYRDDEREAPVLLITDGGNAEAWVEEDWGGGRGPNDSEPG